MFRDLERGEGRVEGRAGLVGLSSSSSTYGIKFHWSLLLRLCGDQLLIQVSNIVLIVLKVCNSILEYFNSCRSWVEVVVSSVSVVLRLASLWMHPTFWIGGN